MGISLVCRLGPGIPYNRVGGRRYRFGKTAARSAASADIPASDRADPGLRMELQRREPPGAGMGGDIYIPHRAGPAWCWRHRFPEADLLAPDSEFRLVGQS